MKTVAFASQKGGAGKSTLAAHLSVLADKGDKPALLIDIDPQGSLAFWHSLRASETPILVQTNHRELKAVLDEARQEGIEWAFIDGPPHDSAAIAEMIRVADLVIIPTRPSAFDLAAVASTMKMVEALKAPHLCVLNSTPPRRGFSHASVTTEARGVLSGMGGNVWPDAIVQRAVLAHAVAGGLAVGEMEPDGASDREMKALWTFVRQMLEAR
ncbi:AAA family ATPase (plasmid) [Aureimonas ureilytica]|uniref:AAA family ATPase n=1 Tax=Aureimonas ureilytica TaxID=401562 RepID=UPI003CEE4276